MTWRGQAFVPAAAALAALVGVCFQFCALGLRKQFRSSGLRHIPAWTRPASGAVGTWMTGCIIFFSTGRLGIFGIGYGDLTAGLNGQLFGLVPVILLLGKFTATVFSYGSGGCGGVFAPSLFLGAMTGCIVQEGALAMGVPLGPDDRLLLEVVGMSASLGAVVRAPFTSILIVFEMTREFSLVPSLLVAGVLSQALSRFILPHGFYEQVLADDGVVLNTVMPPRDFREWQNYPVSAIANFQPVVLDSLEPGELRQALLQHPFAKFLYQPDDQPPSVVLRADMEKSLGAGSGPPACHTIPACLRSDSISRVQEELVASGQGIVAVLDRENGAVVGLLTLHDILRAQQNLAAQHLAG
jgi:CIC family chloride channel protein